MSSPVNDNFKNLSINRNSITPVYIQISQQIIVLIKNGDISAGNALPGTRTLCKQLKVHRKTIIAAYNELESQELIDIVSNKGAFVLQHQSNINYEEQEAYPKNSGFVFHQSNHLIPYEEKETTYAFNDGQPDLRLFPAAKLARWYSASMKKKSVINKLNNFNNNRFFEKQLCKYLNMSRKLNISPENLLTTRSIETSLYIISQLLVQKNDVVLVGELSHFAPNMIFHQTRAQIKTIPMDENGIIVEYIRNNFTKGEIRCVYCSSQRQYPTTIELQADRRGELLELSELYEFIIIEDNDDYDFQYENNKIPPIITSDKFGRVIYIGKFGQSLLPTFQMGFVIAPENLIKAAKNYLKMIDNQRDIILEQVLAEIIYEGEMEKSLKKSIFTYKKRRDLFCKELSSQFGNLIKWQKPSGGLAIWIQFTPPISLMRFTNETEKQGIFLPTNTLYQNSKMCGVRLGFGHLNEMEIPHLVRKLKDAYDFCKV